VDLNPTATAPSLQLRLPAQPESASLLRERIALWLDELGAKNEEIFDVSLASTEAFANALEHPDQPTADVIDVDGSLSGRTITLTVRDHGSWHRPRRREEGGYGFPLMRRLMRSVEIDPQPQGTVITMERQLARKPGANVTVAAERQQDNTLLVRVQGTLDASSAPQARRRLLDQLEQRPKRLVIDVSDAIVDTSGVGVLVHVAQRMRMERGGFRLICDQPLSELLHLHRLGDLLHEEVAVTH
jgi:anti-anti-sigma factor